MVNPNQNLTNCHSRSREYVSLLYYSHYLRRSRGVLSELLRHEAPQSRTSFLVESSVNTPIRN